MLSASHDDDTIAWSENLDGSGGSWSYYAISTATNGAFSVLGIDLDGDGDNNVLSTSMYDDTIAWYENLGDGSGGSWTYYKIYTAADLALSVFGIDLDGDADRGTDARVNVRADACAVGVPRAAACRRGRADRPVGRRPREYPRRRRRERGPEGLAGGVAVAGMLSLALLRWRRQAAIGALVGNIGRRACTAHVVRAGPTKRSERCQATSMRAAAAHRARVVATLAVLTTMASGAAADSYGLLLYSNGYGGTTVDIGETTFNANFWSSSKLILKRLCSTCEDTHDVVGVK